MLRRPPESTRTYPLFPYTTLFRSQKVIGTGESGDAADRRRVAARRAQPLWVEREHRRIIGARRMAHQRDSIGIAAQAGDMSLHPRDRRSEEHTSELQSLMRISYAVFCLKKKK